MHCADAVVTKVLDRLLFVVICGLLTALACAQTPAQSSDCPQTTVAMYSRLRSLGLDDRRVYNVRGAVIDRPNLHIVFDTGTIAFTENVCGRTTGAFFEGEGEVLLRPPDKVERASLALFTGMAILEEQFSTAYFRFNDDTAAGLEPFLSPADNGPDFVKQWDRLAKGLSDLDALRFLIDFSHFLPTVTGAEQVPEFPRLLHARLQGNKLGAFELFWDASASEPVWAGQVRLREGIPYWDVWTSFVPANRRSSPPKNSAESPIEIKNFRIRATVQPPTLLRASTEMDAVVRKSGSRTLVFELSRYLKIETLNLDGRAVDFIQNEALEGTELRRKGNDLVAVVFPAPLETGRTLRFSFTYAGEVLSDAGRGLVYVGERGTWYPNLGFNPAQFDLEFQYPADWTLVATGNPGRPESSAPPGLQVSRWVSDGPIVVAGFNLGKYVRASAKAGNVTVQAFGTAVVERNFPKPPPEVIEPPPEFRRGRPPLPIVVPPPPPPSPARNTQAVADRAARAIDSYSQWFGPYPYNSLSLTQMPGDLSQGWPGLVFLSSFAFLSPQEQADLHLTPIAALASNQVLAHETAHQWWGDLVRWSSYRDQWFVEGLSNYSALLLLEKQNPAQFRQLLEKYRSDLLAKNKDGEWLRDAGPVTLGQRLISSHFPNGYEAVSYERGTWIFHMLRCMMRDAESVSRSRNDTAPSDEPFFRALRRLRQKYAGKTVSTQELLQTFTEELPSSLWYENRRSLDWFLDGWINGTAMPRLEAREVRYTQKERSVTVTGTIVQKDAPDDLVTAVPIYSMGGKSMSLLGIVLADGAETPFRLTSPLGTRRIALDPRQTILTTPK